MFSFTTDSWANNHKAISLFFMMKTAKRKKYIYNILLNYIMNYFLANELKQEWPIFLYVIAKLLNLN